MSSIISSEKTLDVVYRAGRNLKKYFGQAVAERYKTEFATDAVTRQDEETEKFLEKELNRLYPSIGFKGEEYGVNLESEKTWLVDPIDGTGFFMRGVHGCTTMLALIEDGEITFSAIYDFVFDDIYYAQKDKGAYLNRNKIHVNSNRLKDAFLYVETNLNHKENIPTYLKLYKSCVVLGEYPAGIHFAYTASGKVEGRICFDPWGKDYDFSPGQLLVKEAGGVVKNIGTDNFDYKNLNFMAVNKEVYEDLTTGENPIFPLIY